KKEGSLIRKCTAIQESHPSQFCQLNELGLMNYKKNFKSTDIGIAENVPPEVIFILANHKPDSKILKKILNNKEIDEFANSSKYDLRFFVSCFAGYSLKPECMFSLNEFRKLESQFYKRSTSVN
ncbi:MAG: hypothetical protein OXG88_10395, partial [Gammaproteobacteria bacterium]|nr:hypothetical protein [Gammaproteobacteria bacterium]